MPKDVLLPILLLICHLSLPLEMFHAFIHLNDLSTYLGSREQDSRLPSWEETAEMVFRKPHPEDRSCWSETSNWEEFRN